VPDVYPDQGTRGLPFLMQRTAQRELVEVLSGTHVNEPPTTAKAHRRHAIIETTFADLIDGPLAHLPSGRFAANTAWTLCAAICHNLLRAAGSLASRFHAKARGAPLRKHLIGVPDRLAQPQGPPVLHLPEHWPWTDAWHALHTTDPPRTAQPLTTAREGPTGNPDLDKAG
jgi:hypothetical protein